MEWRDDGDLGGEERRHFLIIGEGLREGIEQLSLMLDAAELVAWSDAL